MILLSGLALPSAVNAQLLYKSGAFAQRPATVDPNHLARDPPPYPALAISQQHEGTVVLLLLIDTDGRTKDVKVDHSSGFRELDQAAVKAASAWTFRVAKRYNVAVESFTRIPVTFSLSDGRASVPSQ